MANKTLPYVVLFTVAFGFLFSLGSTSVFAIPITGCTVITQSGTYDLMNDIYTTQPYEQGCIRIQGDTSGPDISVSINGNGYTIWGMAPTVTDQSVGIHSFYTGRVQSLSISNLIIRNFTYGIQLM